MTDKEKELIASTPITIDCFEMDEFEEVIVNYRSSTDFDTSIDIWEYTIENCELLRQKYNETKDKRFWKELIRLLPNSYKVVKL